MVDLLIRFVIGGAIVSAFALLGDLFRPRSFAGLFGAAPSVALATMALTLNKEGRFFAAAEGETMLIGAGAFLVYAAVVGVVLRRQKMGALASAIALMPIWFVASFGLLAWLTEKL
jgi:hypothetical protein